MRVALYERVSTKEQAEHGLSIDTQDEMMKAWCAENGHQIVGVYSDLGVSGRKPVKKRPALAELLNDVQGGKIDLILFQKLDRWTRNVQQYYVAQEILDAHNVAWKALLEDYETITATGRFKVNIMLAVAENEADRTSERIKVVLEHKRANGQMAGGRVPVGYIKKDNVITYDEQKRHAVCVFFDEYIRTASVSKAQQSAEKHGLTLTYKQANTLLSSPICWGGVDFDAPTYITPQQHEIISGLRLRTTRKVSENRVYLFSGMMYCAECGARMYSKSTDNGKYGVFFHYVCSNHKIRHTCDNSTQINENDVEQHLLSWLEEKLSNAQIMLVAETDNSAEIAALQKKISKEKELFVNDLITIEEYKSAVDAYKAEIEKLRQVRPADDDFNVLCDDWKELYEQSDKQTQRGFWLRIIKRIDVDKDRRISFDVL